MDVTIRDKYHAFSLRFGFSLGVTVCINADCRVSPGRLRDSPVGLTLVVHVAVEGFRGACGATYADSLEPGVARWLRIKAKLSPVVCQPPIRHSQELPGDLGRYGRRWLISVPAYTCLEGRVGLCPRVLVSADDSLFVSEFMTSNATSDSFSEELWSAGDSLTGTDPMVISSRWIEGWRGYEQQVRPGTALYILFYMM